MQKPNNLGVCRVLNRPEGLVASIHRFTICIGRPGNANAVATRPAGLGAQIRFGSIARKFLLPAALDGGSEGGEGGGARAPNGNMPGVCASFYKVHLHHGLQSDREIGTVPFHRTAKGQKP